MKKLQVEAGVCGFAVVITVDMDREKRFHVSIDTECEMVKRMAEEIGMLEFRAPFAAILHNPVYRSASRHLKHPACVVPSAILKAIEVEAGVCLPRPVGITFTESKDNG